MMCVMCCDVLDVWRRVQLCGSVWKCVVMCECVVMWMCEVWRCVEVWRVCTILMSLIITMVDYHVRYIAIY